MSSAADSVARADVVSAQGRPIAVGVQITALRDGQLTYRPATGPEVSRPIEQVRYLQISGWEAFNQAEKQQRDGQAALAIAGYEQCLEELGAAAPAAGSIDRRLLVQCRLVRLYDSHGQFDRAVAAYLDILNRMPAAVQALRPARLPKTDLPTLRKAAALVDKAIEKRDRLDPTAISLEKWRATWPEMGSGIDGASERPILLPRATTRPGDADAAFAPLLAEVRSLVQNGKYEQAQKRCQEGLSGARDLLPAELYYWQGRSLLGMAGKAQTDEAKANRRRAGLALLRVVIHSPESPFATESLYRAAEICRDDGRPRRAAALWTELIQTYPGGGQWSQRARQELARLKTTASAPAK